MHLQKFEIGEIVIIPESDPHGAATGVVVSNSYENWARQKVIRIKWDDEDNKGMFVVVKDNLNGETLDKLYETLLLLAIGESFGDTCRAVRVIDKGGKNGSIRTHFEIWCAAVEPSQVQDELRKVFGDTPLTWQSF